MKTLIFVLPSLKTGGGNRVFIELANKLVLNYNVKIIYPNNSDDSTNFVINEKVNLVAIGEIARGKLSKFYNLVKTIFYLNKYEKENIVIITDPIFSLFSNFLKIKILYRFIQADDYNIFNDGAILGNGLILRIYKYLCLKSYNLKIKYIFNSKFVYEEFCKYSLRNDIPFYLVHPAIEHNIFNNISRKEHSNKNIAICLVARKHPWKGFVTFIDSWHILPNKIKSKITKISIISHDDLSNFDTSNMTLIKPNSDIEIAKIYQESDIFISTSWWEGFGLPPLEAMACGCSCILSDSGGINEYAIDNNNCIMFTPKSTEELNLKIIELVENPILQKDISSQAIISSKTFSWDNSANQLIHILENNNL